MSVASVCGLCAVVCTVCVAIDLSLSLSLSLSSGFVFFHGDYSFSIVYYLSLSSSVSTNGKVVSAESIDLFFPPLV